MAVRVLVAADIQVHAEALADLLARESDIDVVAAAGSADEAADRVVALQPDLVLLDLCSSDGAELWAHRIASCGHRPSLVALAAAETEAAMLAWAEAGVRGYVAADAGRDDLVVTLRRVARGEAVYPPRFVAVVFRRIAALSAGDFGQGARLTAREREVLELIRRGGSNKEIADSLVISLATVKNHVHNILEKLGATRRQDAVARWQAGASTTRDDGSSEGLDRS